MNKFHFLQLSVVLCSMIPIAAGQTIVYDSVPSPLPPNVPSLGFQCCSVSEFGDQIQLAPSTPRNAGFARVVMSSWAKRSDYPLLPAAGFTHTIKLNIYASVSAAESHTPLASVSQAALLPWRPEADPTCPGGTAWRSMTDLQCYNGFAFVLTFDLRTAGPGGSALLLPESFLYGVEFNTNTWGYSPLGVGGPFESLNVGLKTAPPSIGTDVDGDAVYVNYKYAPFYTDGGAGGIGTFRRDTAWAPYVPAIQFTTFGFPATANSCKNDGWKTLVRTNFTPFSNQGDCVSYVQNGR